MAAEMAERVGARMRERREELRLTQAEVALRIEGKATGDQVSRWERGKHQPQDLAPIAKALEVDLSYFYVPTPDKSETPDPFAGQDDVADRLDRMETQLAEHASRVEELLARQSNVLERIEHAIQREQEARTQTEEATARLLAAADTARRALRPATRSPEPAPEQQAT